MDIHLELASTKTKYSDLETLIVIHSSAGLNEETHCVRHGRACHMAMGWIPESTSQYLHFKSTITHQGSYALRTSINWA